MPDLPADLMQSARDALNAAHSADAQQCDGRAAELVYADRLETWLKRLIPTPSQALALAARAQHLERWTIPRNSYPMDRPGYLTWRKAVHKLQGERAEALLLSVQIDPVLTRRVNTLVAKAAKDDEGQALEDAACLVFLQFELAGFAATHPEYTREKYLDIIRRTWRKMSPAAHTLAGTIQLAPALADLVREATAPVV